MKSLFTLAAVAGALLPAAQACIGSPGGKCPIWPKEFSSPVSQKTIDIWALLLLPYIPLLPQSECPEDHPTPSGNT